MRVSFQTVGEQERASIRDVARIAGVSVSTASRAMDDDPRSVSDDIRIRVRAVAAAIGYVPSLAARAMRGRRNAIGVIVDDITSASVASMVTHMQHAGRALGTIVLASGTGANPERTVQALRMFRALHARAIVLISSGAGAESDLGPIRTQLVEYAADGGNVVALEPTPWTDFATVGVSNTPGRMVLTRIPSPIRSRAIGSAMPSTPALGAV